MKAIQIIYTCGTCSVADRKVALMERGETETIDEFMTRLTQRVSSDHIRQSPRCMARTMQFVKIPLADESKGIGAA